MRAASATLRTNTGVLPPSAAQRSQRRSSGTPIHSLASDIHHLFQQSYFSTGLLKTLWKRRLNVTERLRIGRAFDSLHQPVASPNLLGQTPTFLPSLARQAESSCGPSAKSFQTLFTEFRLALQRMRLPQTRQSELLMTDSAGANRGALGNSLCAGTPAELAGDSVDLVENGSLPPVACGAGALQ
jgi:hypothetical protein